MHYRNRFIRSALGASLTALKSVFIKILGHLHAVNQFRHTCQAFAPQAFLGLGTYARYVDKCVLNHMCWSAQES